MFTLLVALFVVVVVIVIFRALRVYTASDVRLHTRRDDSAAGGVEARACGSRRRRV